MSVRLATLIEDFTLYPRNRVDDTHVSDLVRALQAGATLPAIVADRSTLRIVDGVHRRRALLKHFGEPATADVDFRDYPDDAAFFLAAVALNAQHGRKLDRHDQTRVVLRLQELNVEDRIIAATLHVPEPEIRTLQLRVVYGPSGAAEPSKRGLEHMRGQQMTTVQIQTMRSVRSAEAGRLALELTRLLDAGLVDFTDGTVVARLRELAKTISRALKSVSVA